MVRLFPPSPQGKRIFLIRARTPSPPSLLSLRLFLSLGIGHMFIWLSSFPSLPSALLQSSPPPLPILLFPFGIPSFCSDFFTPCLLAPFLRSPAVAVHVVSLTLFVSHVCASCLAVASLTSFPRPSLLPLVFFCCWTYTRFTTTTKQKKRFWRAPVSHHLFFFCLRCFCGACCGVVGLSLWSSPAFLVCVLRRALSFSPWRVFPLLWLPLARAEV